MRPDWKDAPAWAMFCAKDEDGIWFWYENEPETNTRYQHWEADGRMAPCDQFRIGWMQSLQRRP